MSFFFLNATATTEIYTLSLHDALPISRVYRRGRGPLFKRSESGFASARCHLQRRDVQASRTLSDRKSTRLNSSHMSISYAVFCLKKKKHADRIPAISLFSCILPYHSQY